MFLTILYWLLVAVMLVGVVGSLIPGLPGASLVAIAILIWGIFTGFEAIGWALVIAVLVLVLSVAIDFFASYLGAKRIGASRWGQVGAIVGLLLGLFGLLPALPFGGPLLGILIGPVLGAFIGEFLYRRNLALGERAQLSLKVALSVVVSSLIGNFIQALLALGAVVVFLFTTLP